MLAPVRFHALGQHAGDVDGRLLEVLHDLLLGGCVFPGLLYVAPVMSPCRALHVVESVSTPMPNAAKLRLVPLDDIATVQQLARRLGKSVKEARALLQKLRVPVVEDTFSERLLVQRLERRPSADGVDLAAELLAAHGLRVIDSRRGHPLVFTLTSAEVLRIGQPEIPVEDKSAFAPLQMHPGHRVQAAVYIAKKRTTGAAAFHIAGLDDDAKIVTPLYVFVLIPEKRVWIALRRELQAFRDVVETAERRAFFTKATGRPGGLRVRWPMRITDFDASQRVVREKEMT